MRFRARYLARREHDSRRTRLAYSLRPSFARCLDIECKSDRAHFQVAIT